MFKKAAFISGLLAAVLLICPFGSKIVQAEATEISVVISDTDTVDDIEIRIQAAINTASPGDTVVVTGSKTNGQELWQGLPPETVPPSDRVLRAGWLWLDIPLGVTVVWKANSEGLAPIPGGDGIFEVAEGGRLVTEGYAIYSFGGNIVVSGGEIFAASPIYLEDGSVMVTGGKISADGNYTAAIKVYAASVTVTGGEVFASGWQDYAIEVVEGSVSVTGGKVTATGTYSTGIKVDTGSVTITGGEVIDEGYDCVAVKVISGTVKITGGTVTANSGGYGSNVAISMQNDSLAVFLVGTCTGNFEVLDNSMIVEVDPQYLSVAYDGTQNGLTRKAGNTASFSNVKWNLSGNIMRIVYGSNIIEWAVVQMPPTPAAHPVKLVERDEYFDTLTDAIAAAKSAGLTTFTLEVIGDVTEAGDIIIDSENITIYGANWSYTVMGSYIRVQGGGSLTLGNGVNENHLTISKTVRVTNGTVNVKDGVIIKDHSGFALVLSGTAASGEISGGYLDGDRGALSLENGAQISEISGGTFVGRIDAVLLSGYGTKIDKISGGRFYERGDPNGLHGHVLFVQDDAQIGEISGGYFEAEVNSALAVVRSGWVDKISGGTFVVKRVGSYPNGNPAVVLAYDAIGGFTRPTGIGTISGGHFSGGYYGLLLIRLNSSAGSQIDAITGGTFVGTYAGLQNDSYCVITGISGGTFTGSDYGILNVGRIAAIGVDAEFTGASAGIWNYNGGRIDEISGGKITGTGDFSSGISNHGTIDRISGGKITGYLSAVDCDGLNKGTLNEISGGVFWATNGYAIRVASSLTLEPGLTTFIGAGRYFVGTGSIFNSDSLVTFPPGYQMSLDTLPVDGIPGIGFKYLTRSTYHVIYDLNGGDDTTGPNPNPETGLSAQNGYTLSTSAPDYDPAYIGDAIVFIGWTAAKDTHIYGAGEIATLPTTITTVDIVASDVTVYAVWGYDRNGNNTPDVLEDTYTVTYNGNNNTSGSVPIDPDSPYLVGSDVIVLGNTGGLAMTDYTFLGWAASASATSATYTAGSVFTINSDTVLYAVWQQSTPPPPPPPPQPPAYRVTVNDSYASPTGAGTYAQGEVVTIHAGARDGYTFTGWTVVSGGVTLFTPNSGITTFTMPANDVTVRANWTQTPTPPTPVYTVTVNDSYASPTGAGTYTPGSVVTINAGARNGYTFTGWTVVSGGVTLANSSSATTTFTMPANDVTVRANWTQTTPVTYRVTVNDSYASTTGAGTYTPGSIVTVNAGARSGYTFTGWTVVSGGVTLANSNSATTTFTMPANDVTVRANWTQTTGNTFTVIYEPGAHGTFSRQTHSGLHLGAATPAAPEATGETGWKFVGWEPTVSPTVTSDVTYVAQWERDGSAAGAKWALVNLILCIAGAGAALAASVYAFFRKRKDSGGTRKAVNLLWLLVAVIAGIVGVVVFFLTENMNNPMRLVDWWTIVNAVIFVIGLAAIWLTFGCKCEKR
ncbi:MAG: InlB B-repeat-containing protein [Dehalococcoidia bacterium]|nr:InlB B-repeat-containing protein [Dehalococcoidia bacterium]